MKKVWSWRWSLSWIGMLWFTGIWFIAIDLMIGFPVITFTLILLTVLIIIICKWWAYLYWDNYSFELSNEEIIVKRGVIGKRKVIIPFERIQNVNIVKGILERIFGLSNIQIETAGGHGSVGTGGYGSMGTSEGAIQGIIDPEPIASFIMAKVKVSRTGNGMGSRGFDNASVAEIIKELRAINNSISGTKAYGSSGQTITRKKDIKLSCPKCIRIFSINRHEKPARVTCPNCGFSGSTS